MFGEIHDSVISGSPPPIADSSYVISLLPALREIGYQYLALEVARNAPKESHSQGLLQAYADYRKGFEIHEKDYLHVKPGWIALLKIAMDLGFDIRYIGASSRGLVGDSVRDKRMFEKLKQEIFDKDEKAKVGWVQVISALGIIAFLSITVRLFSAGVRSYLPLYMVDRHGISPQLAGLVISLIAGSGIIGAPLGGALSDRYGRKRVILFSLSLSGPLLLAVAKLPYGIPLLISMLLYGMTMSVRMPSMLSLIADVVPAGRRTTVLGVYFLIGEEISGIATPVIGRLIDVYGIDPAFTGVAVGLCILSAFALIFRKHI